MIIKYSKIIRFSGDVQKAIKTGVDAVANAVKVTFGPAGRFVAFEEEWGNPVTTNDGVTVAKQIKLSDPIENMAAQMVIEVASKTNDVSGDGTTCACVLTQAIIHQGLKNIAAGANSIHLIKGMKLATSDIVKSIRASSKSISTRDEMKQVASISANDENVGELVAQAMDKVGKEGVVTIEEGGGPETTIEMVEGMQIDRGYLSPYFITDSRNMTASYEDCYIACIDKKIQSIQEIMPILEIVSQKAVPILFIVAGVDVETLSILAANKLRGHVKSVIIHSPSFGDSKKEIMRDIAILTGSTVFSEETGNLLLTATLEKLGKAGRIIVDKDHTTIVKGEGKREDIDTRIDELKGQIEITKSDYDRDKLKERLAKLTGGVAVVNVGGVTETEMRAHKYKVEDALNATHVALEEGIVVGGGCAYLNATRDINTWKRTRVMLAKDVLFGYEMIVQAVKEPFRQIVKNVGEAVDVKLNQVFTLSAEMGYDAKNDKYVDMLKEGIVDPTKTVVIALENAVSIASLLLTTEVLIALDREEVKK